MTQRDPMCLRLGSALRDARKRRGLSTEVLGRLVGCSAEHVRAVETGERDGAFSLISRLVVTLDLTLDMPSILTTQKVAGALKARAAAGGSLPLAAVG